MKEHLKILMISGQYPFAIGPKPMIGGGGAHVYYLCRALAETNKASVVLLTNQKAHKGTELPNFKIIPLEFPHKHSDDKIIKRCVSIARKYDIGIIHGHHYDGGFLGKMIAENLRKPFVLTMHKPPRLTKIRSDYHLSEVDYARWREMATNPIVAANIAYSEAYKQELDKLNARNIRFIFHGVPVEYLQKKAAIIGWRVRWSGKSGPIFSLT